MKIQISEKEDYNIEIPDKVDIETFKGIVVRFNEIDKLINKIYPSESVEVTESQEKPRAIRKFRRNQNPITNMTKEEAIAFVKEYVKMSYADLKELMKKLGMKRGRFYTSINFIKNKYKIKNMIRSKHR
jgi:hypothetical protein